MSEQAEHRSRFLDQEPDTVAIIPNHPDFVIVGTYSLVEAENEESRRKGSLQILPFSKSMNTSTDAASLLSRLDFPFGIYDIQFHPQHPELLGIATSDAQILLYSIRGRVLDTNSPCEFTFVKVGEILVEERHETTDRLAIITRLKFIDVPPQSYHDVLSLLPDPDQLRTILLTATTQFGNTKLIKAEISLSDTIRCAAVENAENINEHGQIEHQVLDVHRQAFNLEAWTVLPILCSNPLSTPQDLLLLSGGDDGHLLTSCLSLSSSRLSEMDLDLMDVNLLIESKREHEAGVVDICSLGQLHFGDTSQSSIDVRNTQRWLILTGSYDENLRLFLLTTQQDSTDGFPHCSMKLLSELKLGGGVWRIQKLDTYSVPVSNSVLESKLGNATNSTTQTDYLLLIAGHTSGAHIVRLTINPMAINQLEVESKFTIERSFTEGHKSLVYAVEARRAMSSTEKNNGKSDTDRSWEVISASFYDKCVCNWQWTDTRSKLANRD